MTLRLNSTGGGYIEIDAPNTASNFSVTMPTTAGEVVVANTGGDVDLGGLTVSGSAGDDSVNIDSSGRLLVGSSSSVNAGSTSSANLQVTQNNAGIPASFYSLANAAGPGGVIALGHGRSTATGLLSDDDVIGQIRFAGADGTDMVTLGAQISAEVDGPPGANDMPGRLVFSTNASASSPTERMKITSTGQIIGVTETNHILASERASSSADTLVAFRHSATSLTSSGTNAFIIRTNGNALNINNSYGALSDAKLKENIVDASSQWDDIKNLRVRNYNFIEGQTHRQIGVIAQEAETVSPGLVTESPDRDAEGNDLGTVTKSVNYSVLYMKAVKALQEAMERIETQGAAIAALEAKVAALEANP